MDAPLAYRMRPTDIQDIVGQDHLVGNGKIIWRMVKAKKLSSMILYGPPGIGKTSIASAIAGSTHYAFRKLNAATDKKKDLEIVVEEAKMSGTVILLLDEVHRLDQPKQDFLLPHLESGRIVLIGATTENPYINIHPAIRSRSQIFELYPLKPEEILEAVQRALTDKEKGYGDRKVSLEEEALTHLSRATDGDVRSALNALEIAVESTDPDEDGVIRINLEILEECLQRKALTHDKDGDAHYDVISALQKSIRGSDVNASLHYLARLVIAGELEVACRRLLVTAYEDIGLGNPAGVERAVTAIQAARQLGLPEARIPLANAAVELALSPKSNTAYRSLDAAIKDIHGGKEIQIPDSIRDAHYSGAAKLNRGQGYKYPHDYPQAYVDQQYLPDGLLSSEYFHPKNTSAFEESLAKQYNYLNKLDQNK
ncbi:MAG: replication-associated recombination protein A [Atopococcus tabaci]|uniref:Replication-associated recombination protein A n=1 Tax=Atopococcus tabaci TaxID=269774 RepID=A0AA43ZSD6_9LACT|nr:replication-associated recombination protein A [Atopococcus tabaci]